MLGDRRWYLQEVRGTRVRETGTQQTIHRILKIQDLRSFDGSTPC